MKIRFCGLLSVLFTLMSLGCLSDPALTQVTEEMTSLDERVKNYLDSHGPKGADMNVPNADGRVLYDLIVENNYTKAP